MAERRRRKKPNRTPSSYVSKDSAKRRNQLANLRVGGSNLGRTRTHGLFAALTREEVDAKTLELFEALGDSAPVKDGDGLPAADAPLVADLAKQMVLRDRVLDFVYRKGFEDAEGNPRSVLGDLAKLNANILSGFEALECSPRSRARLGLDLQRLQSPADRFNSKMGEYGDG